MLSVHKFQGAHEIAFTDFPSAVGLKKSFAPGDHGIVVAFRATYCQSSPARLASRNCAGKLPRVDSCALVETAREARGPVRRPPRDKAYRSVVIGAREIKEVVVLAEPQFVFWFAAHGNQPRARFRAGGVQIQRLLKFLSSLASFAHRAQCARSSGVKVRAFRI